MDTGIYTGIGDADDPRGLDAGERLERMDRLFDEIMADVESLGELFEELERERHAVCG